MEFLKLVSPIVVADNKNIVLSVYFVTGQLIEFYFFNSFSFESLDYSR